MKRFKVGDTFNAAGLYGERCFYRVLDRTADSIKVYEDTVDAPGDNIGEITCLPVDVDNGSERAELWEYMGHRGYVYAKAVCN